MNDKGHCKIAYDSERDRLEISDFYDISSSYSNAVIQGKKEDINDDGEEADELVDEEDLSEDDLEDLPGAQITYGDTVTEPRDDTTPSHSGHRALLRSPNSGAAIVTKLLADKRSDLVPVKGGFGAFESGVQSGRSEGGWATSESSMTKTGKRIIRPASYSCITTKSISVIHYYR
ncbi:hypothetical protein BU17DRAFT_95640 [Hysterangium stoloniferum]|nr:hypothetical protein BU17DRAFT_95640 [Hysterangium stoloniferum]